MSSLRACPCCALVQHVPDPPPGYSPRCPRCRTIVAHPRTLAAASRAYPAAFSLAALFLYPVAMTLPIIEIERLGHSHSATIWTGVVELISGGEVAIGLIVLLCSIVVPVLKIGGIFALCAGGMLMRPHRRAWTYRAIEFLGRWGMIDVLLVAILVAAVKLGNWASVAPGPGALAFAAVVILSLLASATFNPLSIWEEEQKS